MLTPTLNPALIEGIHYFTHQGKIRPLVCGGEGEDAGAGAGAVAEAAEPAAAEPATTAEPATAETAPVTEAAPAAPAVEGAETDPFDDPATDKFERAYVEKLRQEAAERRTAVKAYEEAFTGYDEDERAAFLDIARSLGSEDPTEQAAAAQRLAEVARAVLGDDAFAPKEGADPDAPLTRADLDRIEQEKQAKAEEEQAITAVVSEAKDLGYPEGSPEYAQLLWRAQFETGGDLKAAHEAIEAHKQEIVSSFVEEVKAGRAKWPTKASPGGGAAPADTTGSPPKSWKEARQAALARAEAAWL